MFRCKSTSDGRGEGGGYLFFNCFPFARAELGRRCARTFGKPDSTRGINPIRVYNTCCVKRPCTPALGVRGRTTYGRNKNRFAGFELVFAYKMYTCGVRARGLRNYWNPADSRRREIYDRITWNCVFDLRKCNNVFTRLCFRHLITIIAAVTPPIITVAIFFLIN